MDSNTVLLLEYLHGKSSRLAKAVKPPSWDMVDIPQLVKLLKEKKKLKSYPMKGQIFGIHSPIEIKPVTYSRNTKLKTGELFEEDDEINYTNNNEEKNTHEYKNKKNKNKGKQMNLLISTDQNDGYLNNMFTPTEDTSMLTNINKTPDTQSCGTEPTPISLGNVPVTPKLASLNCNSFTSQMATLRLPLLRDLGNYLSAKSPSSTSGKSTGDILGNGSTNAKYLLGSSADCRLSNLLPDKRFKSELAIQELLMTTGMVMFPSLLEARASKPRTRPNNANINSDKLSPTPSDYQYHTPGCPTKPLVEGLNNEKLLDALDAARRSVLLSVQRLKAFTQVLSYFVAPGYISEQEYNKATVGSNLNQNSVFRLDNNSIFSPQRAGSLSTVFLILCNVLGKLGGNLNQIEQNIQGFDRKLTALYIRHKRICQACDSARSSFDYPSDNSVGFAESTDEDNRLSPTNSNNSSSLNHVNSEYREEEKQSMQITIPETIYTWSKLITNSYGDRVQRRTGNDDTIINNWDEYRNTVCSLIVRQLALIVASLFEHKQLIALREIGNNSMEPLEPLMDTLFRRFLKFIDLVLTSEVSRDGLSSTVKTILSPDAAKIMSINNAGGSSYRMQPSDYIKNRVHAPSSLPPSPTENSSSNSGDLDTGDNITFSIRQSVDITEVSDVLGSFLESAALFLRALEIIAPDDVPNIIIGETNSSQYNSLGFPPNVVVDLLFYVFALLRDEESYVPDLSKIASTLSRLFQTVYGLEDGFGELLLASVASSTFHAEWKNIGKGNKTLQVSRAQNWSDDLAISANFCVLAWNKLRYAEPDDDDDIMGIGSSYGINSSEIASPLSSAQSPLPLLNIPSFPSSDMGLEFRGSSGASSFVFRKAIVNRILECTEPLLNDLQGTLTSDAVDTLTDVLLQTVVVAKMMQEGEYKMVVLDNEDRQKILSVSSVSERVKTNDRLRKLYKNPNFRSLAPDLVPQCFPKKIIGYLESLVDSLAKKTITESFGDIIDQFKDPSLIPADEILARLPTKYKEKASIENDELYMLTNAGIRPAKTVLPSSVLTGAIRDKLLEYFSSACKKFSEHVERLSRSLLPRISRYFVPYREEINYIKGTAIVSSAFSVFVKSTMKNLNKIYKKTFGSWNDDIQLVQIKTIGSTLTAINKTLMKCLKMGHVFGLKLLEVFGLADKEEEVSNKSVYVNTVRIENLGSFGSTNNNNNNNNKPSTKDSQNLAEQADKIGKTLKAVFPNAGKYLETPVSRQLMKDLILADTNDLSFAAKHPRLSVICMAQSLGVKRPAILCEKLFNIFLGEARQKMREILKRLSAEETPKVTTALDFIKRAQLQPDSDNEDVMGTITRFRQSVDVRYSSSLSLEFVALLNSMLEDMTGVSSGALPEGWGHVETLPLTADICVQISAFFSSQLTSLLSLVAKRAGRSVAHPPPLSPLFTAHGDKFTRKRIGIEDELSTPKEQIKHKMHKLKVIMKEVKSGKREVKRNEMEKIIATMSPQEINSIAASFGYSLPPYSPRPSFDKLPPNADDLLPYPERIANDTKNIGNRGHGGKNEKDNIFKMTISTPVNNESELMKKLTAAFVRLNSFQMLEWEVLRFKGTLEEVTRRISALEFDVKLITGKLGNNEKCEVEEGSDNKIIGNKKNKEMKEKDRNNVTNNIFDNKQLNSVTSIFGATRDLVGKLRGEIITSLTSHVIFNDLRPLFQCLYYEHSGDCTFDNDLKYTMLHTLQLMAHSVYPNLINIIARSFLFDLSLAMATVILDTGYRSRIYDETTYEIFRKDFCTIKSMFNGDGKGPVPESFIQSNMLCYAHAVKYNHPNYIAKFQQIVIKEEDVKSFYNKIPNLLKLSSTSQYIRIVNGYRYSNDSIRTGMQALKRKAYTIAYPSIPISPNNIKKK